jgi:hypothetical protein
MMLVRLSRWLDHARQSETLSVIIRAAGIRLASSITATPLFGLLGTSGCSSRSYAIASACRGRHPLPGPILGWGRAAGFRALYPGSPVASAASSAARNRSSRALPEARSISSAMRASVPRS